MSINYVDIVNHCPTSELWHASALKKNWIFYHISSCCNYLTPSSVCVTNPVCATASTDTHHKRQDAQKTWNINSIGKDKPLILQSYHTREVFIKEESCQLACTDSSSHHHNDAIDILLVKNEVFNQHGNGSTKTDISSGLLNVILACSYTMWLCMCVWMLLLSGLIKSIFARPLNLMKWCEALPYIQLNVHYIPLWTVNLGHCCHRNGC